MKLRITSNERETRNAIAMELDRSAIVEECLGSFAECAREVGFGVADKDERGSHNVYRRAKPACGMEGAVKLW